MQSNERAYDIAAARVKEAVLWHEGFVTGDNERSREALKRKLMREAGPGIYEHFKSSKHKPRFYALTGAGPDGTNADTKWQFPVTYYSLYGSRAGDELHREILLGHDGFLIPVNRPSDPEKPYVGPRFRKILRLSRLQAMYAADRGKDFARAETISEFLEILKKVTSTPFFYALR